jgi:hypothetical protein
VSQSPSVFEQTEGKNPSKLTTPRMWHRVE